MDIQKVWLLFSSVVLAFAFVFGNSIRQLYEAVIFLFVIRARTAAPARPCPALPCPALPSNSDPFL